MKPLLPQAPWVGVALALGCLLGARPGFGRFRSPGAPVPLDRLVQNVGRYVEQHPKDARGHYTLGRLQSFAFATGAEGVQVFDSDSSGKPNSLPEFPAYQSILVQPGQDLDNRRAAARQHLIASVKEYQQATQMAGNEALYWMGLGWMLEQGSRFASEVEAPFLKPPAKAAPDAWRAQALAAYRRAFDLSVQRDLAKEHLGPSADPAISLEAGEGILRLEQAGAGGVDRNERTRIRSAIDTLRNKPRAITPIIFPLEGSISYQALTSGARRVRFDLAGAGRVQWWPWVNPHAGILVWDPERSGKILSGRQLFGSATWSMIWRDGYEPLAALDDNGDGWLSGRELSGLRVWRDQNGDARSQPREVSDLSRLGISGIAVHATGRTEGVLCNERGIRRRGGTYLPTYDWITFPVSRR